MTISLVSTSPLLLYRACAKCTEFRYFPEEETICLECRATMFTIEKGLEEDPNGLKAQVPGAKMDAGKVPVMRGAIRYFPRALSVVAAISDKGARKYSWKGWESVPDGEVRYADARGRHELAIGRGELIDDSPGGTGELHLGQVAWNALAELELFLRRTEVDGKTNK